MPFADELRQRIETLEVNTVGNSFGGTGRSSSIFSVPSLRNWVQGFAPFSGSEPGLSALRSLRAILNPTAFTKTVINLIRFSFLIELTNLTVGSTKMKSRWLPGLILKAGQESFLSVQGTFEPGNDQRAASYEECMNVFLKSCRLLEQQNASDPTFAALLDDLGSWYRTPYEFVFAYIDPNVDPVHTASNITIAPSTDVRWLVQARRILGSIREPHRSAIAEIEKKKLEVKAYKTDRSLTGKDKTNRAKRWEVLSDDFQHATLAECWSVEKKLTLDLVNFEGFPEEVRRVFEVARLLDGVDPAVTRCPVTLASLNYPSFAASVLEARHGRSDYQIGHLTPLKRGGRHIGGNICWQSADGNRIQGDLTMAETDALLDGIAERRLTRLRSL